MLLWFQNNLDDYCVVSDECNNGQEVKSTGLYRKNNISLDEEVKIVEFGKTSYLKSVPMKGL